jgi:swainsonine biosynthesis dioxygenase SwnH1/2
MGLAMFAPPEPIDPSYTPTASITQLPATSPVEDILTVLDRDGGIILTDFASLEDLAAIDRDVEAHRAQTRTTEKGALQIIPKETLAVPGLVGKSPTMVKICESSPILENLRTEILQDKFTVKREDIVEENVIDPLLSISITLWIGPGAPRQRLHRDDNIHGIKHGGGQFDLRKAGQFGCLIAGSQTTRANGATMFVPGSHRWDDTRVPKPEEVCFAGEFLILLSSISLAIPLFPYSTIFRNMFRIHIKQSTDETFLAV